MELHDNIVVIILLNFIWTMYYFTKYHDMYVTQHEKIGLTCA